MASDDEYDEDVQLDQKDQYDKCCRPPYPLANSKADCEQSIANRTDPFHIDWCIETDVE